MAKSVDYGAGEDMAKSQELRRDVDDALRDMETGIESEGDD